MPTITVIMDADRPNGIGGTYKRGTTQTIDTALAEVWRGQGVCRYTSTRSEQTGAVITADQAGRYPASPSRDDAIPVTATMSDQGNGFVRIGFPQLPGSIVRNTALCVGFGDSHIEGSEKQGTPTDWRTLKNYPIGSSIYARTVWYAQGRLISCGNYGIGGQRTDQILSRLPEVIATRAGTAIVSAGTNDARQMVPFENTVANLTAIFVGLRAAGIEPVVIELPPLNTPPDTDTIRNRQDLINAWLRKYCRDADICFVGINDLIQDPASRQFGAGMNHNNDGVHLSSLACDLCGQRVAAAILQKLPGVLNPLVTSNLDATNMIVNALGLTDANSDGIPDSWSAIGTPAGGTAAHTLETVSGWPGKAICIEQSGNTNTRQLYQAWNPSQGSGWAPGDVLRAGIRWKVTGAGAPSAYAQLQFVNSTTGQTLYRLFATHETVGDQLSWQPDVVIPSGTTLINFYVGITAGTGKLFFNAPTLINATRQGLL